MSLLSLTLAALLAGGIVGCAGDPPAPPEPLRVSLDAWDEGVAHLEAGRHAEAAASFRASLDANPRAAEVQLWLGRALAAQGDLPAAIAAATAALELRGEWPLAHYNRACWRARAGDLALAAADLSVALEDPSLDRLAVAADTDLDPLRADPRFRDGVPARALPAAGDAVSDPVFLGSEWRLRFAAQVRPGDALTITGPDTPATLRWVKTVEDRELNGEQEARTIEIVFQVDGAGAGSLGPYTLSAGGLTADVGPFVYEFLAPDGHTPPEAAAGPDPLRTPEALLGAMEAAGAMRQGDEVRIRADPGDRIDLSPKAKTIQLVRRRSGQPQWIGRLLIAPEPVTVTITRGGAEVYSGEL